MYCTFYIDKEAKGNIIVKRAPKPGHQFTLFESFNLMDFLTQTRERAESTSNPFRRTITHTSAPAQQEAQESAPFSESSESSASSSASSSTSSSSSSTPSSSQATAEKKEEIRKEAEKIVGSCLSKLTIIRSAKGLSNFFENHKSDDWYNIPEPPKSIPIAEISKHYRTFKIPKASGGFREICAPDEELKQYQYELKNYFENTLSILSHDASHAYTKGRCTTTAVKVHQKNDSHWFLKLDMSNFFPSHTKEYVLRQLKQIYPIGFLMKDANYFSRLAMALEYAFLHNSMPQGTPLSPTLTNICMVPIDFTIKKNLMDKGSFVYTRYADDIQISCSYTFKFTEIIDLINYTLHEFKAPFKINTKKTHYQSRSGSNWNLGIMLNKDNKMSIGHKRVKQLKTALYSLITKTENWSVEDKQELSGKISYYRGIDPTTVDAEIAFYEKKFNANVKQLLKP